jgi:protein subunit release factor A
MDAVIVELRAGEGGDDACEFVREMVRIYIRFGGRRGL